MNGRFVITLEFDLTGTTKGSNVDQKLFAELVDAFDPEGEDTLEEYLAYKIYRALTIQFLETKDRNLERQELRKLMGLPVEETYKVSGW